MNLYSVAFLRLITAPMAAKLRIAGTWSGVLEVELGDWTVAMLREEVARRSNLSPDSINLICAGRLLKNSNSSSGDDDDIGDKKLGQLGVKNNAKILATRVNVDEGKSLQEELMAEEQRSNRLTRLKAAATALAKRHADGYLPVEDFNIELEDQGGKKVSLGTDTDQRAIMMGLMFHAKGKRMMMQQQYKDALEVLAMGEEAFTLCNPKVIECVDNVPILQIDMVWCNFMMRDINCLSVAGERLAKARQGIERAHGKDASRVRQLQGGRSPELALHLRLELLEGVIAFHIGQFEKSRHLLTSAQAKYSKLQVSDEALSQMMGMGYKEQEAKRALKMNNQDVESAINFLIEEREQREKKRQEDIQRREEIREQKRYGKTPLGKAVDMELLKRLVHVGFTRELCAEALRKNENDFQMALDDLTNPALNSKIQLDIESRKRKRHERSRERIAASLTCMGFDRSRALEAIRVCGTRSAALNYLLAHPMQDSAANNSQSTLMDENPESDASKPNSDPSFSGEEEGEEEHEGSSSSHVQEGELDPEMESELVQDLDHGDALADYDIDVTKEAEAITEYLTMLETL